jgi:hypothetical protein
MPYAIFFDILGTSRVFFSLSDDYQFDGPEWADHRYTFARRDFHRSLQIATAVAPRGLRFLASFSDCAYLIYDDAVSLLLATGVAVRLFYRTLVPVRGGVGYGNFGLDRVVHASGEGGTSTEASFFGSALGRAHAAEGCGLKGLRIFVDLSAVQALRGSQEEDFVHAEIDCSTIEEGERPDTVPATLVRLVGEAALSVSHELCFIGQDGVDLYLRAVEMIEKVFPPDERAREHYERSRRALRHFESLRGNLTRRSS